MLDKPEKTAELLVAMRAALPFEVSLTPELVTHLARHEKPASVKATETVTELSYAGDEGGIVCHIKIADGGNMVVASLTHVRVARTLPFAADVLAYQKHRVKKLKRQQARS
jgi:hypothetical protein